MWRGELEDRNKTYFFLLLLITSSFIISYFAPITTGIHFFQKTPRLYPPKISYRDLSAFSY
jgi:hypothetical protein